MTIAGAILTGALIIAGGGLGFIGGYMIGVAAGLMATAETRRRSGA